MNSQSNETDRLMSVDEVATYLGYAKGTVYNKVQADEIPHLRVGGLLRFRRADIDTWIERQNAEDTEPDAA